MKRKNTYMIMITVFMTLVGGSHIAYATIEEDWEKAQSENTIIAYEEFLQDYPDGTFTQEAHKRLEELYLQRIKQTEIYVKWVEEQRQQAPSGELTDSELIQALSRSMAYHAQKIMEQARLTACDGQASVYSAVLGISGKPHAKLQTEVMGVVLPYDLEAITPGDFYYAICLTRRIQNLNKCEYRTSSVLAMKGELIGYVVPQQVIWDITIHEVRTGKQIDSTSIYGNTPTCPENTFFTQKGQTYYNTGEEPSTTSAFAWIEATLKTLENPTESLPKTVWAKASVDLYPNPDDGSSPSTSINQGSTLTVLAEQGEWCKVETENHKIGWIRKNQVSW